MIDGLWKKAALSSSTAEVPLLLMEIEHPELTEPIRVVTDKADMSAVPLNPTEPAATFARNSIATHPETSASVAVDEPRYKPGMVYVEEGTTNLAPGARAMHLWQRHRVTVESNAALAPNGLQEATKVICTGEVDPFLLQSIDTGSPIAGKTFTFSLWAWTDADQPTDGSLFLYNPSVTDVGNINIAPLTTTPKRYSLTRTFAAGTAGNVVQFRIDPKHIPAAGDYLYCWGAQLELKPYATSFTTGTRVAESLTVPTEGVITAQEGTIEFDIDVTDRLIGANTLNSTYPVLSFITTTGTPLTGYIGIDRSAASANWRLTARSGAAESIAQTMTTPVANTPKGVHRFAVRWSDGGIHLHIDGILRASLGAAHRPINLSPIMSLANFLGTRHCNTFIGPIRFSSRARTDEELSNTGPLVADADTTALYHFRETLEQSVRFVGIPLDVHLPQDRPDETPAVSIGIGNVSSDIIKALREIQGDDVSVSLRAVLASNPDHVQAGPYNFTLTSAQWDSNRITGQIGYEQLLNQVLPAFDITPQNVPGSF